MPMVATAITAAAPRKTGVMLTVKAAVPAQTEKKYK
jgi:hypothetical protein